MTAMYIKLKGKLLARLLKVNGLMEAIVFGQIEATLTYKRLESATYMEEPNKVTSFPIIVWNIHIIYVINYKKKTY